MPNLEQFCVEFANCGKVARQENNFLITQCRLSLIYSAATNSTTLSDMLIKISLGADYKKKMLWFDSYGCTFASSPIDLRNIKLQD